MDMLAKGTPNQTHIRIDVIRDNFPALSLFTGFVRTAKCPHRSIRVGGVDGDSSTAAVIHVLRDASGRLVPVKVHVVAQTEHPTVYERMVELLNRTVRMFEDRKMAFLLDKAYEIGVCPDVVYHNHPGPCFQFESALERRNGRLARLIKRRKK